MSIVNLESYISNLWDWGFLNGCFLRPGVRPTDLDGMVELNGHFLYIEAKSEGKEVPVGQVRMFVELMRYPYNTVLILWGEPSEPTRWALVRGPHTKRRWHTEQHMEESCTTEDVQDFIKGWATVALEARPGSRNYRIDDE